MNLVRMFLDEASDDELTELWGRMQDARRETFKREKLAEAGICRICERSPSIQGRTYCPSCGANRLTALLRE